ncbi:sugar transferase [Oenococcus alcoholitolerans]|uniref:sugar transferase n=1 Tax=Oenococcus alcoholitolerans TaxID=931074 RepID=UPI003F70A37D
MNFHITNLYGQSERSTALIAQNMVCDQARQIGFKEIGIYSYPVKSDTASELSKRIDGMFASLGFGDLLVFQMPSWNGIEFDRAFIEKARVYNDLKLVIFVHDFIPYMFENNSYLTKGYIDLLNLADVLILPSQTMAVALTDDGLKIPLSKIIFQNFWDHPTQKKYKRPQFSKTIFFAGNSTRFPFVKEWDHDNDLSVFDAEPDGFDHEKYPRTHFLGWQNDWQMLDMMDKGFGLVWSQKIPNQDEQRYLSMNVSYKLSSYLAAGLPVIVPKSISDRSLIQSNHLGIAASTLEQANDIVSNMTVQDYDDLADHVKNFSKLIKTGYFTKKILLEAIGKSLLEQSK